MRNPDLLSLGYAFWLMLNPRTTARRLERLKYAEADAAPEPTPSRRAERRLAGLQRQLRERREQQISARMRNGMLQAAVRGDTTPDMDVG